MYYTNLLNDATKNPAAKPTKHANRAHKLHRVVTQSHYKISSNLRVTNNDKRNRNILTIMDNFFNNFNDSKIPLS
jgi:hypothetical protein